MDKIVKYQLKQLPLEHPGCFRHLEERDGEQKVVDLTAYKTVYSGSLKVREDAEDLMICEKLFMVFNRDDRPGAKEFHSMSVSDILVLDDERIYFCNSFGFTRLSEEGKVLRP